MKKIIAIMMLSVSCFAMAMPSPSQIEGALVAKDYNSAKAMISEVLREKPDSARAHLLNSAILMEGDKNKSAAGEELKNVVRLDKKGDVKGSALFGRIAAEIEAPMPKATKPVPAPSYAPVSTLKYEQPKPSKEGSMTIVWILLAGAGIAGAVYIYNRKKYNEAELKKQITLDAYKVKAEREWQEVMNARVAQRSSSGVSQADVVRSTVRNSPVYEAPVRSRPSSFYDQQSHNNNNGMGAFGTAASVAGGVVAGNLLTDVVRHGFSGTESRKSQQTEAPVYEPAYEAPAKVDYETRSSSYSSGSDSSWGSSSGSSSSDYSSSSDSGSSWDSGGSSSSSWD